MEDGPPKIPATPPVGKGDATEEARSPEESGSCILSGFIQPH